MVNREKRIKFEYRAMALALATVVIGLMIATPSVAGVHDPMQPQVALIAADPVAVEKTEFHLEATMVSAQRRVAIIDGSTVSIGDQYQGYCVISIDEGCVVLAQRGNNTSLTLQPTIKTPTNAANGTLQHLRGVE